MMRRVNTLPELLAPAGDMECLYAAVSAGADAVYVGGREFGARAYAKNFDIEELRQAVAYCHLHGVKLYVTVNTLVYDREMRQLSDFVYELWRMGVDAVITADLGAIREIRRRAPGLAIHASTQMSVHNTDGAEAAARLGCERVVLARELTHSDIVSVTEKCSIETEVFLHGALCVCHSGQCLMSSLVGGRSGNRGECAQPCRLPYNKGYPLSLSDLSLANHINELIDSGVASLKIEGRMKSCEYVYTVTDIYRKLLDGRRNAGRSEAERLSAVFSRGGFTDGYFRADKFGKMTGVRSEEDKERTKSISPMRFSPERVKVRAEVEMRLSERSKMTLSLDGRSVTVYGETPSPAISSPLTTSSVKERLSKMGGTFLALSPSDINLTLDEGVNLSAGAVNSLRRSAVEALVYPTAECVDVGFSEQKEKPIKEKPIKTAQFLTKELFSAIKSDIDGFFDIVFLPVTDFDGTAYGVSVPPVIFDSEVLIVEELLAKAKRLGAKYALVGNIGHIALAVRAGLIPVGDFRLNITNSYSKIEYLGLGVDCSILSPEITLPMARDIGGGEIVYGRIPLMITERCFIKENFGCDMCDRAEFVDRTGARFALVREFGHRNLILNSRHTYMGDRKTELSEAKISHLHFLFTNESADEARRAIYSFLRGEALMREVRRIGKR